MTSAGVGRLAGKVAVVTGAASGIGKAICSKFALEGASVMMVDRSREGMEQVQPCLSTKFDNKHHLADGDVADMAFAKDLFSNVKENYGKHGDVLVNCAGIIRDSLLINMDESRFDEVIQTNLKSVFVMTKSFIDTLNHPGGMDPASIINISSIVGKGGNTGQANYAASKAGVILFTKSVGFEMGRFGIRCNSVLPGFIKTPMTEQVPEPLLEKVRKQIPMKRFGMPEEIANACLFLASDESSYVNCSALEVTGGLMA
ncbi:(3R)-3-hydroxyacyl-CoA dehydrogenase-like [Clavelina lepadiformis]|uniref:(3R)-3-hydroxyacyl-CoA dehydrogenase-like n=1 Tax=Clavelina lepadiformis TaxID=159417 RepID=UPI0040426090